jgi:hypothetical protein
VAKFRCPVCGKELNIQLKTEKEPVGGLHEAVVQHEDHLVKIYVDANGFVRRAFPVEHFVRVDPPLYTVHIYEDRAEIIDRNGHTYITDPAPLIDAVKKITS